MRKRKDQPELPHDLETIPDYDEVVLKEDEQEADPEPPAGFEDLLHEEWSSNRGHSQFLNIHYPMSSQWTC
jgi:hypothetical protein